MTFDPAQFVEKVRELARTLRSATKMSKLNRKKLACVLGDIWCSCDDDKNQGRTQGDWAASQFGRDLPPYSFAELPRDWTHPKKPHAPEEVKLLLDYDGPTWPIIHLAMEVIDREAGRRPVVRITDEPIIVRNARRLKEILDGAGIQTNEPARRPVAPKRTSNVLQRVHQRHVRPDEAGSADRQNRQRALGLHRPAAPIPPRRGDARQKTGVRPK